jgi:3-isopropylmalate dehydrogenase
LEQESQAIEDAVKQVLVKGYRTPDLFHEGAKIVGCQEMGDLVSKAINDK